MEKLLEFKWDNEYHQWLMRLCQKPLQGWLEPWQWESAIAAENNACELRMAMDLHGRENTCDYECYIVGNENERMVCRGVDKI